MTSVPDEVDLKGHSKSMGSCRNYTNPQDVTSWCVRKWEEAGAIIVGKLNMHELGLGEFMKPENESCLQNSHLIRQTPQTTTPRQAPL